MSTRNNILVTVTGPSLTGKSKLASLLKPEGFEELISTTTRPHRVGEINGVHYHFVDEATFKNMSANKLMIEEVVVGHNFYGVSRPAYDAVISKGLNGVAVVEPHGAQQVGKFCRENNITLHQVFINNPKAVLLKRLLERYKGDVLAGIANDDVYAKRLLDMNDKEPQEWIAPALNGTHHYDQVFDSFSPENEKDIVKQIVEAVKLKLSQKNSTPKPKF